MREEKFLASMVMQLYFTPSVCTILWLFGRLCLSLPDRRSSSSQREDSRCIGFVWRCWNASMVVTGRWWQVRGDGHETGQG